jgi:nitrogen fixation-related uncharacterized protein
MQQIFEKEGKMYITARVASAKDLGQKRLEMLNKYAVNQPLLYRHVHPEANEKATVMGRAVGSEIVEEEGEKVMNATFELFNKTKDQQTHVEYCKASIAANKPIGFSPGWEQYGDEMNPSEMQVYEFSTTHIPYCDSCRAKKVYVMEDKEKQEYEAKLAELRKALDTVVGKNKQYEDEKKALAESIKMEYEKKFAEELAKTNKEMEKMKEDLRVAKIEPIVQKIVKIEGDFYKPFLMTLDEKKLTEHYEAIKNKAPPAAVTETMEESQKRALEANDAAKWKKIMEEVSAKVGKQFGVDI